MGLWTRRKFFAGSLAGGALTGAGRLFGKALGNGGKILGLVDEPQAASDPLDGRPHQISPRDRPDHLLNCGIGCERPVCAWEFLVFVGD